MCSISRDHHGRLSTPLRRQITHALTRSLTDTHHYLQPTVAVIDIVKNADTDIDIAYVYTDTDTDTATAAKTDTASVTVSVIDTRTDTDIDTDTVTVIASISSTARCEARAVPSLAITAWLRSGQSNVRAKEVIVQYIQ